MHFPSRFFLAPINTGYARDGVPTPDLFRFHEARAGHLIGASYVGNVAVNPEYRSNSGTLVLQRSDSELWERLVSAIADRGSVPAVQLACRYSPAASDTKWKSPDIQRYAARTRDFIAGVTAAELSTIEGMFVQSAVIASEVGFRIVQIHAAHGYFLGLLLNRLLNAGPVGFVHDGVGALQRIADGIRRVVPDLLLDIRVSLFDGLEPLKTEMTYRGAQLAAIASLGFDIISLSAGMYDVDRNAIYPGRHHALNTYLDTASDHAVRHPDVVWNVAGNIRAIEGCGESPSNLTFGIGRPLIADPEFVSKSLSGRADDIQHCRYSGACHYFSRGRPHIECAVNNDV